MLICVTPVFTLPRQAKVRKREADSDAILQYPGWAFYLGLTFDNFKEYEDLSKSEPELGRLTVTDSRPDFKMPGWDDVLEYNKGDILTIQVSLQI